MEERMSELAAQLREQISREGPMPFAEFMRRALYDPQNGYYASPHEQIGKRGDFFTSVSVGPFFGELLAFQFARWLESLPHRPAKLHIVEAGAHDAQLARDILEALQRTEPQTFASVEYWLVEPSPARRAVQKGRLAEFKNVQWTDTLGDLRGNVHGVIFSNELLDAFPVHPFAWNAALREWQELGVALGGDGFAWTQLSQPCIQPPSLPGELLDVLPDGYIVELAPAISTWWREAAAALAIGKLLTIDYGATLEELLSPSRPRGTLRAYSKHQATADVLRNPGEQDITAHVNFSEVRRAGEASGLRTETFTTQSQFLTSIARELWTRRGSWPQPQVRQFQTLTHPEHLGRPFRVLVQSRS
jgi:SAM-dependent MidA family methyltransferase